LAITAIVSALMFIVISVIRGAISLFLHVKFPRRCKFIVFYNEPLDFAGEFHREGSGSMVLRWTAPPVARHRRSLQGILAEQIRILE
jgi:hypothetical protein